MPDTERERDEILGEATPPWALEVPALLASLGASTEGLTSAVAAARLATHGRNALREGTGSPRLRVLLAQLKSPLLFLLLFAAAVSVFTSEWVDATIVLSIVLASVGFGYRREYQAERAAAALGSRLRAKAQILRDGRPVAVPVDEVVPGDVLLLAAGTLIAADAVLLEASDCHVNQAVLTGESYPVEKSPAPSLAHAPLAQRKNCVFRGTNVRSGTARCVVFATGLRTEVGAIAHRLEAARPETEFDRGLRRFGYLLTVAMLVLVFLVFGAHVLRGRAPIETLLFSIALAVGLSPELLPAILSWNLARGAEALGERGVLVRHLSAIENLGSMDVLCTDKTGTLTEGVVRMEGAYAPDGAASIEVLELGAINAALETGLPSPLDDAIVAARTPDLARLVKRAEIPFDFNRKRVSVIVDDGAGLRLVTKGAFHHVLPICAELPDGSPLDEAARTRLEAQFAGWSRAGLRVLAVADRGLPEAPSFGRDDERALVFRGFLAFLDPPKEGAREAIAALARLGVSVKVITGDSELVARHLAALVGLRADRVLTGSAMDELHGEALWHVAERTDLFVEVDPIQKERVILALKRSGHVVGFMGDGVNDAPAMHAADTSISVETAVDVAREAADFVLLERDLDVIRRGVESGRRTFANTLKYVLTTTSANLGNMLSMAVASLFLPFLPLTAGQILLNNFLSDIPAVGIATDGVDDEMVAKPQRWDMGFIGRFMVQFGLTSSVFDLVTFAVLLGVFQATPALFQTGWFVESLLTELVIALVVRTRRRFYESRPGKVLLFSTVALIVFTFTVPYLPYAGVLGFVPAPPALLLTLGVATMLYVLAAELLKWRFYRVHARTTGP